MLSENFHPLQEVVIHTPPESPPETPRSNSPTYKHPNPLVNGMLTIISTIRTTLPSSLTDAENSV